ncbi:TPA: peptidase, partial [Candidatus Sumerlaeota bacterium]|nr:peptidase [Candidatus Sumerlaeota bacterium]
KGLYFRDKECQGVLNTGRYWFLKPFDKARVDVVSQRTPWLIHTDLDLIVRSGALGDSARVLDLKENERVLVWIDGRFDRILPAGLYALWGKFRDVRTEVVNTKTVRFEHAELNSILKSPNIAALLEVGNVPPNFVGLYYLDGAYQTTLSSGTHAFWKNTGKVSVQMVDMRERSLDVPGQEIMTSDKVTLRLNAVLTYRVTDPLRFQESQDGAQMLYRETQLSLRAAIGSRELDTLLADKESVAQELTDALKNRAAQFGIEIVALGMKDLILPGEMKDLMNKVTEAKKAAEANLIARREETAAMRNQANTARLLENNPTLMRLRELEVLEKVAGNSKLSVVLGEKGLADRVMNLL